MSSTTYNLITKQLENLPEEMQKKVLKYLKNLQKDNPKGVAGEQLIKFAGCISKNDLEIMKKEIESGCERIDSDEW
jgi:flagellar motor switch protein FliG